MAGHEEGAEANVAGATPSPAGEHDSWAESAGRPGEMGYRFGDLTRIAVRKTGNLLWPLADKLAFGSSSVGEMRNLGETDLAGWLGKRSKHVRQWRSRYFHLSGIILFWARQEDSLPHGSVVLHGALILHAF
ncbi:MAG: hypothetical protein SGPRY_005161 [Prymnesium sp.]